MPTSFVLQPRSQCLAPFQRLRSSSSGVFKICHPGKFSSDFWLLGRLEEPRRAPLTGSHRGQCWSQLVAFLPGRTGKRGKPMSGSGTLSPLPDELPASIETQTFVQEVLMSPSRFAVLAALSFAVSPAAAAQPAGKTILVWSYGFAPNPIHLAADKPVTLTFVNRSGSSHDFVAKTFFIRSTVTAGAAPEGEIDLPPNSTRSISLIPRAGRYVAHCSHFFHKQLGMSDQIEVD